MTLSDFSGGIDRREGLVTRDARKFRDVDNYLYTTGRKLKRRSGLAKLGGAIDPQTQSLNYLNGKLVTIAKAGDTVNHTVATTITTLFFDNPEGAGEWLLLNTVVFNEKVIALIQHTFPSTTAPLRTYLHVWDDRRPTWVEDGALPTTWTHELPAHPFGAGKLGTYKTYLPRMAIAGDRLFVSRADGDCSFSGANDPRIWNVRSPEQVLTDGKWWYFITTGVAGDQAWTIDSPYFDFIQDDKWAAYVLERCLSDGTWAQFKEVPIIAAPGDYGIAPVPNRFDPLGQQETRITARTVAEGQVVRFRAMAKPPVSIIAGLYLTSDGTVVGGILALEAANHQIASYRVTVPPLLASTDYKVLAVAPGAPIVIPRVFVSVPGSMPLNGQQRYWSRIIAQATTNGAGTAFVYACTGTVSTEVNSTRLIGVGTIFRSELFIGRLVDVNGERRTVTTILDDLHLEVDSPFTVTAAAQQALQDIHYQYAYQIGDTGNVWFAAAEAEATFITSGKDDAGFLGMSLYDDSGGVPRVLAAMSNRLLAQFDNVIQSWAVGPSVTDMRLLAVMGQGAGAFTHPTPALMDSHSVLPTAQGIRMFSAQGNNKDYVEFTGIGELLHGIPLPDLRWAVWWPELRVYLTCAASGDNGRFFALTRHQDAKVLAWSTLHFTGLTTVDALTVAGNILYILSGTTLYRLDASLSTCRDSNDPPTGKAYTSRARWNYNNIGTPQRTKKLLRCEVGQEGSCTLAVYMNPTALTEKTPGPPTVTGYTMGLQKVPLMVMGPGIGLEVTSTDETGHELASLAFDYTLRNR